MNRFKFLLLSFLMSCSPLGAMDSARVSLEGARQLTEGLLKQDAVSPLTKGVGLALVSVAGVWALSRSSGGLSGRRSKSSSPTHGVQDAPSPLTPGCASAVGLAAVPDSEEQFTNSVHRWSPTQEVTGQAGSAGQVTSRPIDHMKNAWDIIARQAAGAGKLKYVKQEHQQEQQKKILYTTFKGWREYTKKKKEITDYVRGLLHDLLVSAMGCVESRNGLPSDSSSQAASSNLGSAPSSMEDMVDRKVESRDVTPSPSIMSMSPQSLVQLNAQQVFSDGSFTDSTPRDIAAEQFHEDQQAQHGAEAAGKKPVARQLFARSESAAGIGSQAALSKPKEKQKKDEWVVYLCQLAQNRKEWKDWGDSRIIIKSMPKLQRMGDGVLTQDGTCVLDCAYSILTTSHANPQYTNKKLKSLLQKDNTLKALFAQLSDGGKKGFVPGVYKPVSKQDTFAEVLTYMVRTSPQKYFQRFSTS